MEINQLYQLYLDNPNVVTDSRKVEAGCIFFALKGPNFNGNHYAKEALEKGAAYCITDEPLSFTSDRILPVTDSLATLQQLAKKHREQFNIPFLAITGSNGKTTTKELCHAVLSTSFITYTTEGNLNNHIGIPLTILKVKKDAEIAIIEMGANHLNEIKSYCDYAMPTFGLITNCGKAHLEGFGSEEGVRKAKGELFDHLRMHKGTAFVCTDYAYLVEMSKGIEKIITYGKSNADITGKDESEGGLLNVSIANCADTGIIKTSLVGGYNLPNVLAAVCIGKTFGVPDKKIKEALENYTPSNSRSQLIRKDSNEIILDAYNANPSSMKAAIENFAKMNGEKKVLVLGGMMELGAESLHEHEEVINLINKNQWEKVVLVGKDFTKVPAGYMHFNDVSQARDWFRQQQFEEARILIKGSRSMQMEKVLE